MDRRAGSNQLGDDDMRSHYDFSEGVRGKYQHFDKTYTRRIHHADGTTTVEQVEPAEGVVLLSPDVRRYFPDSEAVNEALRGLIKLIDQAQRDKVSDKPR